MGVFNRVVEFLDGPGVPEQGRLRLVKAAFQVQPPYFLHDRVLVSIGYPGKVREVRPVVPDILVPPVPYGPDHVVGHVVAIPAGEDIASRGPGLIPEKRASLDMVRDLDAGQGQHGGTQVDRTDQVVTHLTPAQVRPPCDQRHVDPRVIGPALTPGQGTVVAPVEHVGIVGEPVLFQLAENRTELAVVVGDMRIHAGQGRPNHRRVGQVGRRLDVGGIELGRRALFRPHSAFVTAHEVEDREEGLFRIGTVAPVGVLSQIVPCRQRRIELVVGLGVVRAVVARRPQVFGEALDVVGHHRGIGRGHFRGIGVYMGGPHVVRTDGNGVHTGDDRRTRGGAHPGS